MQTSSPPCPSVLSSPTLTPAWPPLLCPSLTPPPRALPAPRGWAAAPACRGHCRWKGCPSGWAGAWSWRRPAYRRLRRRWARPWWCSPPPGSSGPASGWASEAPGSGFSSTPEGRGEEQSVTHHLSMTNRLLDDYDNYGVHTFLSLWKVFQMCSSSFTLQGSSSWDS